MNNAIVRDATPRLLDGAGRNGSSAGHEALTFRSEALRGVYAPVLEPLERVQARLKHLSGSQKPQLSPLFEHALANPGKLVRPAIGLLASRFHPNDGRDAETLGVAVELLHVASLVHDDTVDDSETRRGRATVSRRWGPDMALLLGDYLMATAANIVCDIGNFRVIRRFTTLVVDLSTGELHERADAHSWQVTCEQYLERIYQKTASLFSTAAESGAVLSGASDATIDALSDYGRNLGMAFQIVDDIVDFHGTVDENGRPKGSDLAQGVMTLPAIIAVERYPEDNPIDTLFRNGNGHSGSGRTLDEVSLRRALELVRSSSVIDEAYELATHYCDRALDSLTALDSNRSRESLERLAAHLIDAG